MNGRILVVDDSKTNRTVTSSIVSTLGFQADQAEDGAKALEMAMDTNYDAILLDLVMPDMDGFEVLLQLRQEPKTMKVPVIVISGNEDIESVVRSIEMGAVDYIHKPMDATLLSARLRTCLTEKRIRDLEQKHLSEVKRIQARLSAVIGDSPLGIILVDLDARVREVNPKFMEMMLAKDPADLKRSILDFFGKDDMELLQEMLDFFTHGTSGIITREVVMHRLDGTTFNANLVMSMVQSGDGSPPFAEAMVEDITRRKKAESALRENEQSLRMVFKQAPYPLVISTFEGKILDINQRASQLLEVEHGQIAEVGVMDFYARPEDRMKVMDLLSSKGFVEGHEIQFKVRSGKMIWALMTANPITLGDRRCLITALYDITERRLMERSLEQANRKLGLLNSITRHDIVNQTVVLSGYLDLTKRRFPDKALVSSLDRMSIATENITKQINFTKDYQDLGVKGSEWFDVGKVFEDAFKMIKPDGVDIENNGWGIMVLADHLVGKAFYNLIDNSMRHGEYVTKMKLNSVTTPDKLILRFEDNGCGIDYDDKLRLFEKGFGKNTGLGLFLTKEILSITSIVIVENGEFGKGVCFEMHVPTGNFRSVTK